jgi:hypothetical protein
VLQLFKLEKLEFKVFKDRERTKPVVPNSDFRVMFNPESYSQSYENVFNALQGINTSSNKARYSLSKPSDLKLKLIFDGSGVTEYGLSKLLGAGKPVPKMVQEFLESTAEMDGNIHEPHYLTIAWGDLNFKCRLKTVTVNYTLFDNSGIPLRAELDTAFVADIDDKTRLKKENKNSPDLTHWRIVKAHDTLPLMCEQIYGSADYVIKVARANKLNDFRNLVPGQQLFFPPIQGK